MPKKIKNCFYKNLTFVKLLEAHKRARNHKTYKEEVIKFEINLENNLINLLYHLGFYGVILFGPLNKNSTSLIV